MSPYTLSLARVQFLSASCSSRKALSLMSGAAVQAPPGHLWRPGCPQETSVQGSRVRGFQCLHLGPTLPEVGIEETDTPRAWGV